MKASTWWWIGFGFALSWCASTGWLTTEPRVWWVALWSFGSAACAFICLIVVARKIGVF